MAGTSISALAGLLAATSFQHDDPVTTDHVGDQGAHGQTDTNTTCREAVRRGAARKARALSKHRPVLLRWAPSTTCTSPQQQPQRQRRRSRQQQQHTQTNKDERKISNYGSRASSEDVPPAAATTVRSEEFRGRDELVAPQLSLVTTESLGRHIVAGTGGIPVGTVVLKEAPYAWALTPEFHGEFCAHCLRETLSEVVCPDCGLVAYCSVACAEFALQSWHGSECLDDDGATLAAAMSGMSPACRVALRAFRRARREKKALPMKGGENEAPPAINAAGNVGEVSDMQDLVASGSHDTVVSSPASSDGGGISWPAVELAHLQELYTERSARARELLETEAAVAAVLARGDGSSKSAGDGGKEGRQPCELLAAELVTSLFKVSTNGFAVSFLRRSEPSAGPHVQSLTHAKVAVGLYLKAAMLNHSCRPNALVTFNGREMRVVVTRAIAEGEPVTISYGPLASKVSSASERQAYLRRAYFFQCECAACRAPPTTAAITPPDRADDSEDDAERQSSLDDRRRDAAAASSKRTDFACVKAESDRCPGTLLVGVPPLPSDAASPSSTTSIGKGEVGLWCDHCGNHVPFGAANDLLKEDVEDRRLWDEGMEAVSLLEKREECNGLDRGGGGSRPPSRSTPSGESTPEGTSQKVPSSAGSSDAGGAGAATASTLRLVVERVKWRDARLSPLSMRRAAAHDMHARILAGQKDFAGAADACARALAVLVKRFAPEDQELGVEFLKLAELCFNAGWMDKCYRACRKARLSLGVLAAEDEQLVALDRLQALCAGAGR